MRRTIPLLILPMLLWAGDPAQGLICEIEAPPVLSITEEETGPFTLSFTDFVQGTTSNTQVVVYQVQANHLAAGALEGTVSAKLNETFDDVKLEASVDNYQNLGESSFATLVASSSGFSEIGSSDVALADKQPGGPCCDSCIDGNLTISWRATLTKDLPPGNQSRSLIVTLRDGL